jgi:erythronate-4-phosphate dehydrogenase
MIRIIADDKIPFLKSVLEPYAEVLYMPGKDIDGSAMMDADALLIRTRTKCTEFNLRGTKVSFIGTATIGFDHIDTQYCEKNNIKWTNAPGCNSSSVYQYISTALLKISSDSGFNLKDKTIGIVGVGNVGSKVEKFARSLGMNVLLNDPPRASREGGSSFHNLSTVLQESDIVTIHVPLNTVGKNLTYHILNEKNFKKMNKCAWLINSSRGEVVSTLALKQTLESGKLSGAVLDVWENEPDIDLELMEKSFIATPHIAGYSTDGKANGTAIVVNALCDYFNLSLKNWYPLNVPAPPFPEISIEGKTKSDEDIIREAVYHTYDISEDDERLRFKPSEFEKQRGDYPMRREFTSYKVKLTGGTEQVRKMLVDLGFKVVV